MAATEKNVEELRKASQLSHVPRGEQYDKMISGMLYDSFVPELCDARFRARAWAHQYNHFFPTGAKANATSLQQTRAQMLREILGRVDGDDVVIEPPFNIDYGCNISIGERFYANFNLVILDCAIVTIGNRVMMGPNVSIFAATHETEVASRRDNIEYARPVSIGDDCWIGGHVVVLPGVTIGKGCVIAAGSIVTKDVPAWSVAKGVPARVFKSVEPIE